MSNLAFGESGLAGGEMVVRPFRGSDTEGLLTCWERALPLDGVTRGQLEARVLLDDNFERGGLGVALADGTLAGFVSCFVLRRAIEKVGLREDDGFIQAMGVDPAWRGRGVGSALLKYAEAFFRQRGRQRILMAPYTPNYFVPGVDKDRYAEGLTWLGERGFVEYSEGLAADALIGRFEVSAEVVDRESALEQEGIAVRPLERGDIVAFMEFMYKVMPGPWVEDGRRVLRGMTAGRVEEDVIWIAVDSASHTQDKGEEVKDKADGPASAGENLQDGRFLAGADLSKAGDRAGVDDLGIGWTRDGRIIGFCQHEGEHFGPFGVMDGYQGRGIGSVLLSRTLYRMRMKGCHSAWVLWTGERALKGVYGRLGFTLSRRFAILKKELGE